MPKHIKQQTGDAAVQSSVVASDYAWPGCLNLLNLCLHSLSFHTYFPPLITRRRGQLTPYKCGKDHRGFIIMNLTQNPTYSTHIDLSMTLRLFKIDAIEAYCARLSRAAKNWQTTKNWFTKGRKNAAQYHQHNLLNAIFFEQRFMVEFCVYKHKLYYDKLSRIAAVKLLERIQNDIIFPNETHFPNEAGHRKWVCKSYFVLIMF